MPQAQELPPAAGATISVRTTQEEAQAAYHLAHPLLDALVLTPDLAEAGSPIPLEEEVVYGQASEEASEAAQ